MPVARELVLAELGERRLELHVAGERLPRRSHERVLEVVADAGQRAEADQLAPATCSPSPPTAAYCGMALGQPHLRHTFSARPADAVTAAHVVAIGAAVVEQVELDQLDALVLEIEQRAVDAAAVGAQVARSAIAEPEARSRRRSPSSSASRSTGCRARHGPLAAAAARGVLAATLPRKRSLRSSAMGRSPRSATFRQDSRLSCWVAQPPTTSDAPRRSDPICLRMVDLQEALALQFGGGKSRVRRAYGPASSNRRSSGKRYIQSPTTTMVPMPPIRTAGTAPNNAASTPDSNSPS